MDGMGYLQPFLYFFRAKNMYEREIVAPSFFECDQVSFLCTSGTCVAGDKKDTQDLNQKTTT